MEEVVIVAFLFVTMMALLNIDQTMLIAYDAVNKKIFLSYVLPRYYAV